MAFNFNSGQVVENKTDKKAGFNFESGRLKEMDSASYKKAGNDMLDLSKKTLDPVKQRTYQNLAQQYFDKAGSSIQETMSPKQGLGEKLLERGKNIVEEFKPKKETSTYEKVSNALGGKMVRVVGQAAGAVGDIAGTAISAGAKKIYETAYTPEQRELIKQNVVNVLDTSVGQAGLNAIKSGVDAYSEWKQNNPNVAKDLESVVNIGTLLPVGKGIGVAGKAAAEATTGVRKSVAKTIIGSAEKNVSEALAPTTKEAKLLTEKIAPEFIKKGIVGSRETILKKAEEGVADFGKQIETYISSGKLKGEVAKRKITDVIDSFAKSGMTEGGIVLDSEKVKLAETMKEMISKFGDNIPAEEAKSALRVLGEMTARKKGFTTGGEKLAAQLEKDIYGSIAGELAKANPNLDKLNKTFSFYKNLAKVTQETITRTKPQSGMFRKAAAVLFAGQGQGVFDTAIKYIGSKLFLDFVSGPFYKTASSKIKNGLAKAIYSGDIKGADTIINAAKEDAKKATKTILDKVKQTPVGMSIKDVSGGKPNPLIQEARKFRRPVYKDGFDEIDAVASGKKPAWASDYETEAIAQKEIKYAKEKGLLIGYDKYDRVYAAKGKKELNRVISAGNRGASTLDASKEIEREFARALGLLPESQPLQEGVKTGKVKKKVKTILDKTKKIRPGLTIEDVSGKDLLIQEARKYRSAEEFVNSVYYRGERGNFGEFIKTDKNNLPITRGGYSGIPTTKDYEVAKGFGSNIRGYVPKDSAKILSTPEEILKIANKKNAVDFMFDRSGGVPPIDSVNFYKKAKNLGYDGVDLSKIEKYARENNKTGVQFIGKGENELRILNKEAFVEHSGDKSQLTDIWNKANGKKKVKTILDKTKKQSK